jgi:ATP-binding cassette subfamily C protein
MMWRQLRKCLHLLPSSARLPWLLIVPMAVLTAAAEAVGAAAVFALVQVVTDPAKLETIPVLSAVLAHSPWRDDQSLILACTALVAFFYLIKNGLVLATEVLRGHCTATAVRTVSSSLLRLYLRAPYSFHLQRNSAEIIRNTDFAVQQVFTRGLAPLVAVATEVLVVAGLLAVLIVAAPLVTLAAGAVLLLVSLLFLRLTRRLARDHGSRTHVLAKELLRHLQQALGAIKEVKVLRREPYFLSAFTEQLTSLTRIRVHNSILATLPRVIVETVFITGALAVIVLVTLQGATGPDTVSLLGLFAYAGFRVIPSVNRILWQLTEARYGTAAVDDVYDDFVTLRQAPAPGDAAGTRCLEEQLTLENVSYRYDGAAAPALAGITLTIRRGESLGVVGPTGAGKSTLVDLLIGLLPATGGRVLVDGVDIGAGAAPWRRIGYVPQTITLLDDTMRRNIALGVADEEIDEEALRSAVDMAQLGEFVGSLPDGLKTVVGERGVRLSGGERQRVGIARALYADPELLVFDEATSALDTRTEAALVDAIRGLRSRKTLIVVAHRLTTVQFCDRIVVVHNGGIEASGTFAELADRSPTFRALSRAVAE